jgi:hypothetical protein
MIKSCGCPYGCCSCGPYNDNLTDVYYNPKDNEFFLLTEGASAMSPVGWCGWDKSGMIYLGKLGDNYYEFVGRTTEHENELKEFRKLWNRV